MKRKLVMSLVVLVFSQTIYGMNKKEITLENLYIPPVGYDNNDRVEVVLTGKIPSLCYELGKTSIFFDNVKKVFTISQSVKNRELIHCENNEIVLEFQKTISLGQLETGKYKIVSGDLEKNFLIKKATISSAVDDELYAPLSSAFILDLISTEQTPRVILGGKLDQSCLSFNQSDVELKYYDDVIVLLPRMILKDIPCFNQQKVLQAVIPLQKMAKGKYLIHIRTMSGQSINKVFEIIGNTPQNSGL